MRCRQASFYENNIHQLCTVAAPSKEAHADHKSERIKKASAYSPTSYAPKLKFTYNKTEPITLQYRSDINLYQKHITLDDQRNKLKIDAQNDSWLTKELDKSLSRCNLQGNDLTILKLDDKGGFFLATEGYIETCYNFTWGMLITLFTNCQLSDKTTIEYSIEGTDMDHSTALDLAKLSQITFKLA